MKTRQLPKLNYNYDSLVPYIDAQTMEIHYSKHHQTYVDKLNEALEKDPSISDKPLKEILSNIDSVSDTVKQAVRNHGGGHFNHSLFWLVMSSRQLEVPQQLLSEIDKTFTNMETFMDQFTQAALSRFGSGWAWLVKNKSTGKLEIYSTANQDNPLMENKTPILGLDVWEHAYYLKYQNLRAQYTKNFFELLNWDLIEKKLS